MTYKGYLGSYTANGLFVPAGILQASPLRPSRAISRCLDAYFSRSLTQIRTFALSRVLSLTNAFAGAVFQPAAPGCAQLRGIGRHSRARNHTWVPKPPFFQHFSPMRLHHCVRRLVESRLGRVRAAVSKADVGVGCDGSGSTTRGGSLGRMGSLSIGGQRPTRGRK